MRAFIAIPCPDEVKDRLAAFQSELKDLGDLKLVERENMHLTLKFLGEIDDLKAAEVSAALDALNFRAYDVAVKGVGVFPKPDYVRVIWAGVEDNGMTRELSGRVDGLLKRLDFPAEKDFHPHFTLARVKFLKDRSRLREIMATRSNEIFGEYKVDKISLMKSVLSPKGPTYSEVKGILLA